MSERNFWRQPVTNGTAIIILAALIILTVALPTAITTWVPRNHQAVCLIEPTGGRTIGLGANSCKAYADAVSNKCTAVSMTLQVDGGFSRGEDFKVAYICPIQRQGNYMNMYGNADFCTNFPDSVGCTS